jgi:hypothetical protein
MKLARFSVLKLAEYLAFEMNYEEFLQKISAAPTTTASIQQSSSEHQSPGAFSLPQSLVNHINSRSNGLIEVNILIAVIVAFSLITVGLLIVIIMLMRDKKHEPIRNSTGNMNQLTKFVGIRSVQSNNQVAV